MDEITSIQKTKESVERLRQYRNGGTSISADSYFNAMNEKSIDSHDLRPKRKGKDWKKTKYKNFALEP